MKIKLNPLNEILTSFEPNEFLMFLESYEKENRINPFIHKHLSQRLKQDEIEYGEDTKNSLEFFEKNKEILKQIDTHNEEIKTHIVSYIIMLNIIYQDLKDDIIEYSKKTKELEELGIDNIIFGFNPIKRKVGPTIVSKNLKAYIKTQNGKKIDSLKIHSNGIIENSKLVLNKNSEDKIIACVFDLKDPTFVLETTKDTTNNLYLLGTEIDLESIKKLKNLNQSDFEFNANIENLIKNIILDDYNYNLEIEYPELIGKNPKQLYR